MRDAAGAGLRPLRRLVRRRPRPRPARRCLPAGTARRLLLAALLLAALAGCAKYNTYYNAKKAFDEAEHVRDEAIRKHEDPPKPAGLQKTNYELSIQKAQKVLDEYPGHDLTDDALFLQAKAWHRLECYRMSIRKLDLLFPNFPASEYMEEALYLQGLNYLLIDSRGPQPGVPGPAGAPLPRQRLPGRDPARSPGTTPSPWRSGRRRPAPTGATWTRIRAPQERDRIGLKLAECLLGAGRLRRRRRRAQGGQREQRQRRAGFPGPPAAGAGATCASATTNWPTRCWPSWRTRRRSTGARGEVRLVEAESMVAQQRPDDAVALLEGMPAGLGDPGGQGPLLGHARRPLPGPRGLGEGPRAPSRTPCAGATDLDDPERTRRLGDTLKDYLAADQALVDASGADGGLPAACSRPTPCSSVSTDPPRRLGFYAAAAADTAADSTVAARALYGAIITYRDYLDEPDSARSSPTSWRPAIPIRPRPTRPAAAATPTCWASCWPSAGWSRRRAWPP